MAYLIGSLPTAYLLTKRLANADIRELGDSNAGAANVYRNLGARHGLAVGAVDIAKGTLAVLLAKAFIGGQAIEMTAGLAAVVGHNWPFYLQFRGGRGAATALGALMAFIPLAGVSVGIAALAILILSKRVMMALTFAFVSIPAVAWFNGGDLATLGYAVFLPTVVGVSHYVSVRQGQDPVAEMPERR